jgi:integrase
MGRKSPLGIEGTGLSFRDPDDKGRMTVAMVRAKDEAGTYQTRRFPVTSWKRDGSPVIPSEATDWARETRHSFIRGESVAGVASFQHFAGVLVENLEAAGISQSRLDLIRNVSAGLESESIEDMKADNFAARVRKWVAGLTSCWSMKADDPLRRKPKPLSPATRNKILVAIRQVVKLAITKRRLAFDPLAEVPTFKVEERHKPLFTVGELRQMVSNDARDRAITAKRDLLAEIETESEAGGVSKSEAIAVIAKRRGLHPSSIWNALRRPEERDPWWLACCLLVYTGCRAQEAMHLRWEWIIWDQRIITLKLADDYSQKTDSERLIPLEPELAEILRPMMKPHGHILSPQIRSGSSGMKLQEVVRKGDSKGARDYTAAMRLYLQRIGIDPQDRTAHSLRHCYITMKLARADMNVERLRKAVGHRDFSTTQGYAEQSQFYEAEVDLWPDSTLWLRRTMKTKGKTERAR